jgi:hypothetical protein
MCLGRKKYFWGHVPAVDIVRLKDNEGESYDGDLNLLFAASGDLRNLIKSVVLLPDSYDGAINLVVNDMDIDRVARNIIMLLVLLTTDNRDEATECVLHMWYSVLIKQSHLDRLSRHVRPLIEEVVGKVKHRAAEKPQGKTWTFGLRSLRVVLLPPQWVSLLSYLDVPQGLSRVEAARLHRSVTMAPDRVDHRHRKYLDQDPKGRICDENFRQDGILLPFGYPRETFKIPNT